ncbi:hypothetical protein B0T25DRAFT_569058 [Lasiosphaeria hispida]|uniref:Uncharacterized protein n=1 Tax=Lasiosphaeria hispida TaxID=260671 RepID=A0AAJ0MEU1_9PEZI|nr:hypothetical protein B0T25DRAFT_569058 [Lasiosphaeria hispida]
MDYEAATRDTHSPLDPVGHDKNFLYRLYPKAYDLRHDSDRWDYKVELPEHVLAFQNAEGKEEFAFLQLGKLEYTIDGPAHWPKTEDGTEDDAAAEKLSWKDTGFNLVARVGPHGGHIDGVYAVFNMHVEDNFTGDTYTHSPSDDKWGRLPNPLDEEQFFCARLADKLGGFCGCHLVCWGQIAFYKPVPLVMLSKDRLVIDLLQ